MSSSTIIFGGNTSLRDKEVHKILDSHNLTSRKVSSDIHIVDIPEDKKSIGIDQIRAAISFLGKKPFENQFKAVVIYHSEALTIEAQNALLKTLEEPPEYALVILAAKTEYAMLPTILSRCIKIQVKSGEQEIGKEPVVELLHLSKGKLLEWAAEKSKEEKSELVELLETWLEELHYEIKNERKNKENSITFEQAKNAIQLIQVIKDDLEKTNINTKLVLEYLALNL